MNTQTRLSKFRGGLAFMLIVAVAATATAETAKNPNDAAQRRKISDMHKKMAAMHAQMSTCLESNKSVEQCHRVMKETCSTSFGGPCPMQSQGHMGGSGMMGNGSCIDGMMTPDLDQRATGAISPAK